MNLVFMHGWGYTPRLWDSVREQLTEYPTIAPALCPLSDDLQEWANEFAQSLPPDALLIGWSLGAMLALACGLSQPDKIRGLILLGASPKFVNGSDWGFGLDANTVEAFRHDFASHPARTMQRFLALQLLGDASRKQIKPLLETSLADPSEASLASGLAILARADLRPQLSNLKPALKLLHGEQDALMPLASADYIRQKLPHAKFEAQAATGHAVLLSDPPALAARIREFAREC